MKIGIVTPCFNSLGLLRKTAESVLGGGYENMEYIIVDGGSSDGSPEFIRGLQKRLHWWCSEKDKGPYAATNKGFLHTDADIMAWLNAGDVYFPWTLQEVDRIFSEYPEINWIMGLPSKMYCGAVHDIKESRAYPREFIKSGLYLEGDFGPIQQESCFWRRSLWEKAGLLREDLKLAADFELWTRFAGISELVSLGTLLGGFSFHDGRNRSIVHYDKYREEALRVIDEFPADVKSLRKKIIRELAIFKKAKNYTGTRGLARRALNLDKYKGKVLKWNFDNKKYILRDESYF